MVSLFFEGIRRIKPSFSDAQNKKRPVAEATGREAGVFVRARYFLCPMDISSRASDRFFMRMTLTQEKLTMPALFVQLHQSSCRPRSSGPAPGCGHNAHMLALGATPDVDHIARDRVVDEHQKQHGCRLDAHQRHQQGHDNQRDKRHALGAANVLEAVVGNTDHGQARKQRDGKHDPGQVSAVSGVAAKPGHHIAKNWHITVRHQQGTGQPDKTSHQALPPQVKACPESNVAYRRPPCSH